MQFVSTVLLIDDNPSCNFIMGEFIKLADDRIEVLMAESVQDAVALLDDPEISFPDVIYVDLNMPVQNGFEFIQLFERKYFPFYPHCRLFMLTSSLRAEDKDYAMSYQSVRDFVSKNDIDVFLRSSLQKAVI
ncbi:MAG: response regulator [Flavobacteriales bacterium]|nr:response regulator [Flavobacteriales bacterium]